ncbi:MAG: serpin family protein [Lachnospiraceae bacterium]|nr:serpin family protein [Lachnospiraceae bacterium]
MRKNRKQLTACLLAAAMTSSVITGCQQPEALPAQKQEAEESSVAKLHMPEKEEEESMEKQNYSKGKTWEAKEPEKAELSPEDYEGWNQLLAENEISEAFAEGLDRFAYESGSAVLKEVSDNGNYSPLSLYYTLALAGCGARGKTADQILEKLGVKDQKELAKQCRRLYQSYGYGSQRDQERMAHYGMEDYQSAIQLGNSLWISDQLNVYEEYQKLAAENFFASSYGVDFGKPDTGKRMGEWIAQKTNGILAPQLDIDPSTLLVILNTLYFYGGWAEPFSEEMTQEDVFYLENGGQDTVPYLNRTQREGAFKKGEGFTLSYLATNNGCRMMFLLPDEGRTVGEFLESPERLKEALEVEEDWVSGKVIWKVPKFDFGSSYPLQDILKAMGMERMFDGQAEFGGISPEPLMVSDVIQETHIGVDENGVEGAAYTMMAMARGAMIENEEIAEMILNRPFLFAIRDDYHGIWLFLGVCRNPEGESEERSAQQDLLLTSAPPMGLKDVLSSNMQQFIVQSGNYSWNWLENGKRAGIEACGSHPLGLDREKTDILKIPDYNGIKEVDYILSCTRMPKSVTVREWDISQLGKAETAEPSVKEYTGSWVIPLKPDKVYELIARWPEEELAKQGFFGEASYVVVTD